MDNPFSDVPQVDPRVEMVKSELERRQFDEFMVYNPTETDYVVTWGYASDQTRTVIPNKNKDIGYGKGKNQIFRYLAEKYFKEMKNKLINEMGDRQVAQELANIREKGGKTPTDYEKQELYNKVPRTDDEKLTLDIYKNINLGLVKEFGRDLGVVEKSRTAPETRTLEERVMDQMNRRYVEPTSDTEAQTEVLQSPTASKKSVKTSKLLDEISA